MDSSPVFKQVDRISVRSVIPVGAAIFFVLGAVTALATAAGAWFAPGPLTSLSLNGPVSLSFTRVPPFYVFVLYPFLTAAAGSFFSALLAWLYNVLAPRVGPLRVRLSD